LAGGKLPEGRIMDGKNILPLMTEPGAASPHDAFYYYFSNDLHAVRCGNWKLKLPTTLLHEDRYVYGGGKHPQKDAVIPEALYNLYVDPGEQKNVLKDHPDIAEKLHGLVDNARADMGDAATGAPGKNVRPVGMTRNTAPWLKRIAD
jgi:hypothetical protein